MYCRTYLLQIAATILLSLQVTTVNASCFNQYYTFTEVLANQDDTKHIFTCEILVTYKSNKDGYTSIAVVKERFRGNPFDTVYITSGGFTSQRGRKMPPSSEWLIISDVANRQQYTATICENLSVRLSDGESECESDKPSLGTEYLNFLELFQSLETQKFTGEKEISFNGKVRAKGVFLNGKAHGKWKHYGYGNVANSQHLFSKIDYQYGKIEGFETRYDRRSKKLKIKSQRFVKNGKEEWITKQGYSTYYNYKSDNTVAVKYFSLSENMDTLSLDNRISFYLDKDSVAELNFLHGAYINLEKYVYGNQGIGNYFKGARVGPWISQDKDGNITESKTYPFPDTTQQNVIAFDSDGTPAIIGALIDNKPVGIWTYYLEGKLAAEWTIDENHRISSRIRQWNENRKIISPFKEGQVHGIEIFLDSTENVVRETEFVQGVKHGQQIIYDANGSTTEIKQFKNGRPTTVFSRSTNATLVDGFYNGKNIQLAPDGKSVYWEGEYWMGYLVGNNIRYKEDGSYSIISYYPTDHQIILNACQNNGPIKTEFYDKDGQLTMTIPE